MALAALVLTGESSPRGVPLALSPHGGFTVDGEYGAKGKAPGPVRYGSWSGSDAHTGTLTSGPFIASRALILTLAGYPSHPGERIELVRTDDPRVRLRLAVGADPGEHWQRRIALVPAGWIGRRIVLVATDAGTGWGDWLGLSDVHASTGFDVARTFVIGDVRLRLLVTIAAAFLLGVPCLPLAAAVCRAAALPPFCLFAVVLIVLGIWAEAAFFITLIDARLAAGATALAAIGGTVWLLRGLREARLRGELTAPDAWRPFAVTAIAALAYAALGSLGTSQSQSLTSATMTWLGLPTDNILPHVLAARTAIHAPAKPFVGDWLSSDRPPLQAGFDLLFTMLTPFVRDADTRYQAIALVLQATIFGAMFALCRGLGATALRAGGVNALALVSSFFFTNTIFVWPKLAAAAFAAAALVVFAAGDAARPRRAALIGVAAGLAWLSHGAVIFTFPALIIAWLVHDRAHALRPLMLAAMLAVVVAAPWMWYVRVIDPPGDRLLKWHLAGHIPVSREPFVPTLVHAYAALPFATVAAYKADNAATVIGLDTPARASANLSLRDRQFFIVRYALGALAVPYLAALCFIRSRRRVLRRAAAYAWIALGANLFWILAMFGPSTTIVHQGSYLTIVLMYVAAGCVAAEWFAVFALTLLAQALLFVSAWLPMFEPATFASFGHACDLATLAALAIVVALAVRHSVVAALRRLQRSTANASPTPAAFAANNRELLTLGAVAIAFACLTAAAHSYLAFAGAAH